MATKANIEETEIAREPVYDVSNGYRDSAETMFRRLRHQGFTPEWDFRQRHGVYMSSITIPQDEVGQLRQLQATNPATWGNHPEELANENFQAAIEALERVDQERGSVRYLEVMIENTTNAAFSDTGREQEVSRIIEEAADKLDDWWGQGDGEHHPLRDLNGNTVGYLTLTSEEPPRRPTVEGGMKLSFCCELDNNDPAHEAAQHLREAAQQITKGNTDFPIYDTNGNRVGDGTIRDLPSLEKEGVIDMSAALGDVYLAEDSYSGIAVGEYRYVVPTNGFQPGYHQGEGDAWLVNAKGEKAPGYEEPQTVRETDFRKLKQDEREALRDIVQGRVTFEDFERRFEDDDPAP